jgi:hypothetical protein
LANIRVIKTGINVSKILKQLQQYPEDWGAQKNIEGVHDLVDELGFPAVSAGVLQLVMGGVQAIARSTYSKFLPETTDHASYFSFYDATEKIGIVLGTLFFGMVEMLTGSIRYSIISVTLFFVLGLILLFLVPKNEVEIELKEN